MSEKEQPLKNRSDNTLFNTLYKINVKDVTEKRNNLTYLSWAWAWAEVSKVCEAVDYEIYHDPETICRMSLIRKQGTWFLPVSQSTE